MRIPPSVIVMSVVTAVPFGLAVRASVLHRDGSIDERASERAEAEAKAREYEAQELREAEVRDEYKTTQRKRIAELFGLEPASLGPLFDGVALGSADHAFGARATAVMKELHVKIHYEWDVTLTKVEIRSTDQDVCAAMSDRLDASWHDPETAENEATIWLDSATHQRAVFLHDTPECTFALARYVPVEQWVDQSRASIVPLWAVGQRVDRLQAALGDRAHSSEPDSIEWVSPGPDASTDVTRLVAEVEDGRVVAVTAWSMTTAKTTDAITNQLVKVLGPATTRGATWTWTGHPAVTVTFDNGISVRVGKAPNDEVTLEKIDL